MTRTVELGWGECLELLKHDEVGRVAVSTPMGPRIVPVNYTMTSDDEILFRTTPYSEVGTYGRDSEVAFEVDDLDVDSHAGATAVAVGWSEALDPDERRRLEAESTLAPWTDGRRRHLYLRLHIRQLTGRRMTA